MGQVLNSDLKSRHTVLQIRENPKINAPGISKYPTERSRNFVHKFKIFQKSADVLPSN